MSAASVKALGGGGGGGAKELQSITDRDAAPLASPFTSQTVPTMMWFKVGWLAGMAGAHPYTCAAFAFGWTEVSLCYDMASERQYDGTRKI